MTQKLTSTQTTKATRKKDFLFILAGIIISGVIVVGTIIVISAFMVAEIIHTSNEPKSPDSLQEKIENFDFSTSAISSKDTETELEEQ